MESFESIIWNGCSKSSFKTKLKFEMSNSRKMWKYLPFLINSAVLDNYFYLVSYIEAKFQKQVIFCFLQNSVITSISGVMYNIIAKNNIKVCYFQSPLFGEFPKYSGGTYCLKIL